MSGWLGSVVSAEIPTVREVGHCFNRNIYDVLWRKEINGQTLDGVLFGCALEDIHANMHVHQTNWLYGEKLGLFNVYSLSLCLVVTGNISCAFPNGNTCTESVPQKGIRLLTQHSCSQQKIIAQGL
jgi:hypothetical protein